MTELIVPVTALSEFLGTLFNLKIRYVLFDVSSREFILLSPKPHREDV
jgi:hypothetical protein